ncbi:MAG: PTS sugar transporter subunit IIA [Bullifex sp.]
MGLAETIRKELIINPLTSADRDGIIRDLVARYASFSGCTGETAEKIVTAVKQRELLGSTAMEKGVAIPHAKVKGLSDVAVVIGISRLPVDFGGAEKSRVFFLVLAPDERPQEHIQTLSSIARLCTSDVFVRMLTNSRTPDEVYQLFFD